MILLATEPILPALFVCPLAIVALMVIGLHVQWMRRAPMPDSRRRIRMASNAVSMLAVPLFAAGFGLVSPDHSRLFVGVWFLGVNLLGIIVVLAGLDMFNNLRLHARDRRALRQQYRGFDRAPRGQGTERRRST